MIRLETRAPFPAFCFLIKIPAKSSSISMSATASSRQYYPKHNLILNGELRPTRAGERRSVLSKQELPRKGPFGSFMETSGVVWGFLVSPVGMLMIRGRGTPGLGEGCHRGLFLNQDCGKGVETNRLGR